jgi:hypothetical protein
VHLAVLLTLAQAPANLLVEVPFTLHQNAIIVPAVVNGRDTVRLLLDTGWGPPVALVAGAATRVGHVTTLAIGRAVKDEPFVEVFATAALAPLIGPHDGVLGSAFFRDLVLQVDYPARVVRVYRRAPSPRGRSTSVPLVFAPQTGTLPYSDSLWVDGTPVRGLFDTGGAGAFVAMRRLIERLALRPIPDSGPGRVGIGMLSGDTMVQQRVQFTRVGRVSVGTFAVDSPRVMLAPSQLAGDDWGHDVIVGYGFLRHYVVTFDYVGRRVVFSHPD